MVTHLFTGAPWPDPGPHYVDMLLGTSAGFEFSEREALYDKLAGRGVKLDRASFRRVFGLYLAFTARPEQPVFGYSPLGGR